MVDIASPRWRPPTAASKSWARPHTAPAAPRTPRASTQAQKWAVGPAGGRFGDVDWPLYIWYIYISYIYIHNIYIYHIYINGYMVYLYMANPKSGQRLIAMDLANFFLYIYTVYILCIYIYNICMYVWLCMAMGQVSETEGVAICNYSWTTKGWA